MKRRTFLTGVAVVAAAPLVVAKAIAGSERIPTGALVFDEEMSKGIPLGDFSQYNGWHGGGHGKFLTETTLSDLPTDIVEDIPIQRMVTRDDTVVKAGYMTRDELTQLQGKVTRALVDPDYTIITEFNASFVETWEDVSWGDLKVGDVFREMEEVTIHVTGGLKDVDYTTLMPKMGVHCGPHIVLAPPKLTHSGNGTLTWGVKCEPCPELTTEVSRQPRP